MDLINKQNMNLSECQTYLEHLLNKKINRYQPSTALLTEIFFTLVQNQQLNQAETLFRWMVENNICLYSIVDWFYRGVDRMEIKDDRFLMIILGTKYNTYRKQIQYQKNRSTKIPNRLQYDEQEFNSLIQKLQSGDRSDTIVKESLKMWHDNKKARKTLPRSFILSIADKNLIELFLGINFVDEESSHLGKTVTNIIQNQKQPLPKIESLFKIFNVKSDTKHQDFINQWYEMAMEKDQLDVFNYFYSTVGLPLKSISKAISRPSDKIVNWVLDNMNSDWLTFDLSWMRCSGSYRNVRVFQKVDDYMDKFCQQIDYPKENRKAIERCLLQKLLFNGSKEVLEHFLPMLTEKHEFPKHYPDFCILNNMDLVNVLLDPSKNDKISIRWSEIKPFDCKVGLWLHRNGYLSFSYEGKYYHEFNSLILDAIEHKNSEFLLAFGIERVPHVLNCISTFEGLYSIESMTEQMIWLFDLFQEKGVLSSQLDVLLEFIYENDYDIFFQKLVQCVQSGINISVDIKSFAKMIQQKEMKCFQVGLKHKIFDLPQTISLKHCKDLSKLNDILKSLSLSQKYEKLGRNLILKQSE